MFNQLLPAPNPIVHIEERTLKVEDRLVQRNCFSGSPVPLTDYMEENSKSLIYQRFDNSPFNMIPLNNLRFVASIFFDIRKLSNMQFNLLDLPKILWKYFLVSKIQRKQIPLLHPKFDSQFESGNLYCVQRVGENEYDLMMSNDTNSKGHTQWFYFSIEGLNQNQVITINIINFVKNDSLFNYGQRPVTYSMKQKRWSKVCFNVCYYKNRFKREYNQKTYYTLSFQYKNLYSNDKVYFAHCYPYTYHQMIQMVNKYSKLPLVSQREICKTIGKHSLSILTIGNGKKAIILMARQHPGETPGSWAIEGSLEFLTSETFEAEQLRWQFTFYIIPMINPDGVVIGNYRCNLNGTDLNRIWHLPHKELHDTVYYVKEFIKETSKQKEISMIIDFHGHSKKHNGFFYGNNPSHEQKLLPLVSSIISKMISFGDSSFSINESKRNTARVNLQHEIKGFTYTFEISFHGYGDIQIQDFNEQSYKKIGYDVALSLYKVFESIYQGKQIKQTQNRALNQSINEKVDNMLKTCNLSTLDTKKVDDSGSDSNPEEDLLQEVEVQSLFEPKKVIPRLQIFKNRKIKFDKWTQTEITYYQNLILDENVLSSIEEQMKTYKKDQQPKQELNYTLIPQPSGCQMSQSIQTDISLQQILGKMQIYHVRINGKNRIVQQPQQSKPMVILLKNPYTQSIENQFNNKNRRQVSLRGRSSLEQYRLGKQFSLAQQQTDRRQTSSFQVPVSPNEATFEKLANISKIRFYEKPFLKHQ